MMSCERKNRGRILFWCAALFLAQAAEAVAQRRAGPLDLAPPQGVAILRVDWNQARGDSELRKVVRADEFERVVSQVGLESREIAEWVVFSDLKPTGATGQGVILRGHFDGRRVAGALRERGWGEETYRARPVYVHPSDGTRLSFAAPGLITFGSKTGVEGVLDTQAAPHSGLARTRPFSTVLADLERDPFPISFVIGILEKYQAVADLTYKVATKLMNVAGLGILGMVMDKIGLVRALGFAVTHTGRTLPVKLLALMPSEPSAGLVSGTLNLLQGMGQGLLAGRIPPSQQEMLRSLSVTQSGALLSIRMSINESDLPR